MVESLRLAIYGLLIVRGLPLLLSVLSYLWHSPVCGTEEGWDCTLTPSLLPVAVCLSLYLSLALRWNQWPPAALTVCVSSSSPCGPVATEWNLPQLTNVCGGSYTRLCLTFYLLISPGSSLLVHLSSFFPGCLFVRLPSPLGWLSAFHLLNKLRF